MAVLSFPSIRPPSQATLQLVGATQQHTSPFDGSGQTIGLPGQYWRASMTWGPIPHTEWRAMQAWFGELRGPSGRFTYVHPHTFRQATAAIGTPLVNGAGQTGISLTIDGCTPSVTVMKKGDYFSMQDPPGRSRMYICTADVVSNGSGAATVTFSPPLRSSPPDNTALNLATPSPIWRLADNSQGAVTWDARNVMRAGFTLEITEAVWGAATTLFTLDQSVLA